MTTLPEVLPDLRDETAQLDSVLGALDAAGWHKETPAAGWDTHDTIAHLADTNDVMYASITGGTRDLISEAQEAIREAGNSFDVADPKAVDVFTARAGASADGRCRGRTSTVVEVVVRA